MGRIVLSIHNWDKYNERKDVKNPSWFRLQNNLWLSQDLYFLSAEEKWVWVSLLCHASQQNKSEIEINDEWFCHLAGVSNKILHSCLNKLAQSGCIALRTHLAAVGTDAAVDGRTRTDFPVTDRQTNIHNRQTDMVPRTDAAVVPSGGTEVAKATRSKPELGKETQQAIISWYAFYKEKYQSDYPRIPDKEVGILQNLVRTHSLEKLKLYMQVYLQMEDRWVGEECHPVHLLPMKIPKIAVALNSGQANPSDKNYWSKIARLINTNTELAVVK